VTVRKVESTSKLSNSSLIVLCHAVVSGEISGHNRSRSECFQLQPGLDVDILWFSFYEVNVYSLDSSKMISNFPKVVMNFNQLSLKLHRFICWFFPPLLMSCTSCSYHRAICVRVIMSIFFFFFFFSITKSSSFLRQKAEKPMPKHKRQLTTWQVFCQVERRFRIRESNRQPLP
jgi:hypothetical protein